MTNFTLKKWNITIHTSNLFAVEMLKQMGWEVQQSELSNYI